MNLKIFLIFSEDKERLEIKLLDYALPVEWTNKYLIVEKNNFDFLLDILFDNRISFLIKK